MKRILWMCLLALALPLSAFASQVDFTNSGGVLTGSSSGMALASSKLIAVNGLGGMGLVTGGNLGTLTFSTGMLTSGTLGGGATFAGGGAFDIVGNGSDGLPSGAIFTGTFSGPVTWTMATLANGTHNYTLQGTITGTWYTGVTVSGATIQLTINTGEAEFSGKTRISSGDSNVLTAVPEPGSLGLLGTGLVGLAGVLRRRTKT